MYNEETEAYWNIFIRHPNGEQSGLDYSVFKQFALRATVRIEITFEEIDVFELLGYEETCQIFQRLTRKSLHTKEAFNFCKGKLQEMGFWEDYEHIRRGIFKEEYNTHQETLENRIKILECGVRSGTLNSYQTALVDAWVEACGYQTGNNACTYQDVINALQPKLVSQYIGELLALFYGELHSSKIQMRINAIDRHIKKSSQTFTDTLLVNTWIEKFAKYEMKFTAEDLGQTLLVWSQSQT